ncbi:MAG: magnesium transporter, partial [Candidatus Diapherotrites archaeon]|nr:magnesium transporter [Candidatus Diapherotrites archaeon]
KKGFIVLDEEMTLKDALAEWKKLAHPAKLSYVIYVTSKSDGLVGILDLKELLLDVPEKKLKDVMKKDFVFVHEKHTISHAVGVAVEKEISEMPVLDKDNKLIGVIFTDKLIDAIEWVNTRSTYNLAGILRKMEAVDFNIMTIFMMVKSRVIWLLFAVLIGIFLSANIIKSFEVMIISLPAITFFLPVLMGFGGNIGTQTSTIFVRYLARKDPAIMRSLPKLFIMDLLVGLIMGLFLGALSAILAIVLFAEFKLALVLFITMVFVSVFAIFVGFVIPYASNFFNFDPALVSGPLVTAIKDVTALLIYFGVICLLL